MGHASGLFVPQQYINFMSQLAPTVGLCRAEQCLIGFRSIVTPPEACFHLLFQQHLERNGGDYIPPVVSRRFYLCRSLGIHDSRSRSMQPRLAAGKPCAAVNVCYSTSSGSWVMTKLPKPNKINCLLHKLVDSKEHFRKIQL